MGTDPNLAGAPSTTDFQLGVFAERLASLQGGMQRLENTQQQTFGLIKEMNAAHNTAIIKLETVEQRTKTLEADVIDHAGSITKKADDAAVKDEVRSLRDDVEDLKKGKWMVLGAATTISALFALAGFAASLGIKHLG